MWFSQGCSIGCQACNESSPIPAHAGGDLCPGYTAGNKKPTLAPEYRTYAKASPADGRDWTRYHPWRSPGSVPGHDPCGIAGGSTSNRSFAAGGFGYETGYPQGHPGSKLPPLPGNREVWTAGADAEVAWVSAANHGGGYQYSLCPASKPLTEACFNAMPLDFVGDTQKLRYIFLNDTDHHKKSNHTEVVIGASRVSKGVLPAGSTWSKNPVPAGSMPTPGHPSGAQGGAGDGNLYPPQFTPPEGCDDACWGYQPCNVFWTHPSWEGWNKTHMKLPDCAPKNGEGCCHTLAYVAIVDQVKVPDVPPGHYVVRWRWDCEQSPQIWSGCGDITIVNKE